MSLRTIEIFGTACPLILGVLLAAPAAAQVVQATVEVQGMSCPFCAFGVEKRLGKVDGVGAVEIAMKEGRATVRAREGASIDLAGVPEAVRRAGFTPGRLDVEAVGVAHRGEGASEPGWVLAVGEEEILLADLPAALAPRLADLARRQTSIRVRGVLRLAVEGRPVLTPVEVEEVR